MTRANEDVTIEMLGRIGMKGCRACVALAATMAMVACSDSEIATEDDSVEGDAPDSEEPSQDGDGSEDGSGSGSPLNVLFLLVDDLGIEALSVYSHLNGSYSTKAQTPNIEKLAQQGITFNNAWAAPLSSPTRAAALTGKYGHKNGIITTEEVTLSTYEKTLHSSLPSEYSNALFGKWHLSEKMVTVDPTNYGIGVYAGLPSYSGLIKDYNEWIFVQNGKSSWCTDYATTKITDLALTWIEEQTTPWFCWLAAVAPHDPFHLPPTHMHTFGDLPTDEESIAANKLSYFLAMVESLDYEVGRIMESVDEQTIIIFMGDNGTSRQVIQRPYLASVSGKETIYEGGVRVPLIVSGGSVANKGSQSNVLITAPDIYATVMELSGESMSSYEDSHSFAGVILGSGTTSRQYSFAELVKDGYYTAIRNATHKLISLDHQPIGLYTTDTLSEGDNLLDGTLDFAAESAYSELTAEIKRMNLESYIDIE